MHTSLPAASEPSAPAPFMDVPSADWQWLDAAQLVDITQEWAAIVFPATLGLWEWQTYRVRFPGAQQLRVGGRWLSPLIDDLFLLRIENQLGLVELQPFAHGHALASPLWIEVLSPKFNSLPVHHLFLDGLLDDLFKHQSTLTLTPQRLALRGVQAMPKVLWPAPLQGFQFLCNSATAITNACTALLARPHQVQRRYATRVPLVEVAHVEADTLLEVLQARDEWQPAPHLSSAQRLGGQLPRTLRQTRVTQSYDSEENRWAKHILTSWLQMAQSLPKQRWWNRVETEQQSVLQKLVGVLQHTLSHAMWHDVEPQSASQNFTLSRVLRRSGYRELAGLWQNYQRAPQPLWGRWEQALQMRDIATLYEIWTFFELADLIGKTLQTTPQWEWKAASAGGLEILAQANFGGRGTLLYNQLSASYSTPLRPDFSWIENERLAVVFDAKFRLDSADLRSQSTSEEEGARAKREDLYKMHTYRDALGVRAALCLYPGRDSLFYAVDGAVRAADLHGVLMQSWQGIGALALQPQRLMQP
jgi:hypothetical protein